MTHISEAAVEAAAKALFHAAYVRQPDSVRERFTEERQWSWLFTHDERNTYRAQAKAALASASPFIAAQALREAAAGLPPSRTKPRYEHINYFHWLNARAADLEARS